MNNYDHSKLPEYQCSKKVRACKISAIEIFQDMTAKITLENGDVIEEFNYGNRFNGSESDLGYYVAYKDGYVSWSPTKAFEEGYSQI